MFSSSSFSRAGETEESVERENCVSSVCDVGGAEILMDALLPGNGRSDDTDDAADTAADADAAFVVVDVMVVVSPLAVSGDDADDDAEATWTSWMAVAVLAERKEGGGSEAVKEEVVKEEVAEIEEEVEEYPVA